MKTLYLLFVACVVTSQLYAQSSVTEASRAAVPLCPVADAGPDVTLNRLGVTIGPATVIPGATYRWSPTNGLSDPNVPNPVVNFLFGTGYFPFELTLSSTYSSVNLVNNGDFSQGNTGFETQYTYISPGTESWHDLYTITPNPRVMNSPWCDVLAGTPPNNLMVIDGSQYGPGRFYWAQNIAVEPNTNYIFAFDAMSVWNVSPSYLGANINGVTVIQEALSGACGWEFPRVVWNSGSSTTARIVLYSFSFATQGNDFAVDNIRLMAECPPTTDVMLVYKKPFTPCPTCPPLPLPTTVAKDVNNEVSVYPNPAQHLVNVQLDAASDADVYIEIRDRYGKVVRSVDDEGRREDSVPVEVQGLPNGVYTISVRSGNHVTTKRFVVNQ